MNGAVHLICGIIVFHTLDTASTGSLESQYLENKLYVCTFGEERRKKDFFFKQGYVLQTAYIE
jgi:hypothetical protein